MDVISFPDERPGGKLTEEESAKVAEIKKQIDASNANSVIQYGVGVQSRVSDFADRMLAQVRRKGYRSRRQGIERPHDENKGAPRR